MGSGTILIDGAGGKKFYQKQGTREQGVAPAKDTITQRVYQSAEQTSEKADGV